MGALFLCIILFVGSCSGGFEPQTVQKPHGDGFVFPKRVGVGVQRELDRRVAENLAERGDVHSEFHAAGGKGVPQRVEVDFLYPRAP